MCHHQAIAALRGLAANFVLAALCTSVHAQDATPTPVEPTGADAQKVESAPAASAPESAAPPSPSALDASPTPPPTAAARSVAPAVELPHVTVTADALQPSAPYQARVAHTATKTDTPVSLVPASVQVVPEPVLRDQQVTRIDQALENVSGIYPQKNGSGDLSFFSLRGFPSYDGSAAFLYRDGVRADYSSGAASFPDLANIERVEVLKGPASILYGRIEPGGLVNLVTKQPLDHFYASLQQQIGSYRFFRTSLDATGPLVGKTLLGRVNFAYENRRSFQEFQRGDRIFVAPVLQWNIQPRTHARIWLDYLNAHDGLLDAIPALDGRPAPISRSRNFGEKENGLLDTEEARFGLDVSHEFNDDWKLRGVFDARLNSGFLHPDVYNIGVADPANCTTDECTLNRALQATVGKPARTRGYFGSMELTGHFDTLSLHHTLLAGADYWRSTCCGEGNGFATADSSSDPAVPTIDLYQPQRTGIPKDVLASATEAAELSTGDTNSQDWWGVYAQDQIELPYRVHVLGGLRYNYVKSRNPTDDETQSKDGRVTPRVGLLWRALDELGFYASYVQNFGAANGRTMQGLIRPQSADQWEGGVKADLFDGRLHATLSAYTIDKRNSALPDPNPGLAAMGFVVPIGEIRNRGLELDVAADLTHEWSVIASYSLIDSKILKDRVVDEMGEAQADNTGHRLFGVPSHGGSLWTTYNLRHTALRGLRLGAGLIARSKQWADNENSVQLKGYVLANAMLGYGFEVRPVRLSVQLNLDNLYVATYCVANGYPGTSAGFFGSPRRVLVSLRGEI